jgi:large subunit ribosomal protein L21
MNAVIETGGKQYRVAVGDKIEVERLASGPGEKVKFPVLLIENGENVKVGRPTVEGAVVTAEVVAQRKGPKLIAYTYRRRKGSERKVGHRQPLTLVKITDIKG